MTQPRTSGSSVRFATYNLLDLFESDSEAEQAHYEKVREVIGGLGADVLAVQEIRAPQADAARARLRQLAADVGMKCVVPGPDDGPGRTALAYGSRGYYCGLLWRPELEPVPGAFRESPAGRLWHGAGWLTLDAGGVRVRHGTFHATPFGRRLRADQNELLLAMLRGGPGRTLPLLIGADWNTESADRIEDSETGHQVLYEPADPFADVDWFEGLIHQCDWEYDWRGRRRHWAREVRTHATTTNDRHCHRVAAADRAMGVGDGRTPRGRSHQTARRAGELTAGASGEIHRQLDGNRAELCAIIVSPGSAGKVRPD